MLVFICIAKVSPMSDPEEIGIFRHIGNTFLSLGKIALTGSTYTTIAISVERFLGEYTMHRGVQCRCVILVQGTAAGK